MQKAGAKPINVKDLTEDEIEALIGRCQAKVASQSPIDESDFSLLMLIVQGFLHIQERLQHDDLTLTKLRKLLGMQPASEKTRNVLKDGENSPTHPQDQEASEPGNGASSAGSQTPPPKPKKTRNGGGKKQAAEYKETWH